MNVARSRSGTPALARQFGLWGVQIDFDLEAVERSLIGVCHAGSSLAGCGAEAVALGLGEAGETLRPIRDRTSVEFGFFHLEVT